MQSEIVANWIWDVNILLVLERKLIWMNCAAAGGVGTPSLPRAAVKVSSLRSRLLGCATHYFTVSWATRTLPDQIENCVFSGNKMLPAQMQYILGKLSIRAE
ncbi:MAG: hypothetical protein GX106_03180 [Candidatus Cloacimonetes bacterium]|jgi:hypothetical protein|nr:hypothetical protein [Candidatus Cloacimonadota bacterium]